MKRFYNLGACLYNPETGPKSAKLQLCTARTVWSDAVIRLACFSRSVRSLDVGCRNHTKFAD